MNLTVTFLVSETSHANISLLDVPDECGKWFLLKFPNNDDLLSLLHVSPKQITEKENDTHRSLTFHSLAISDLYTTKLDEDTTDDEITPGGIRCFDPSLLAGIIMKEHCNNFARAAYLELRSTHESEHRFHSNDFQYILNTFQDLIIAEAFVNIQDASSLSSVLQIFEGLIKPIQTYGSNIQNVYYFNTDKNDNDFICMARSVVDRAQTNSAIFQDLHDDDDAFSYSSEENDGSSELHTDSDLSNDDDRRKSDGIYASFEMHGTENNWTEGIVSSPDTTKSLEEALCPLFVKILLDDKEILFENIPTKHASVKITVCASTFGSKLTSTKLPSKLHSAFSQTICARLNEFVATQQLERLRSLGPTISSIDLKTAMKCVAQAHDITDCIPIEVYSKRQDLLCLASLTVIDDDELDFAYDLFVQELLSDNNIEARKISTKSLSFFVVPDSFQSELTSWVFFRLQKERAQLVVAVHHSLGSDAACKVLSSFKEKWLQVAHRVNQKLLLER